MEIPVADIEIPFDQNDYVTMEWLFTDEGKEALRYTLSVEKEREELARRQVDTGLDALISDIAVEANPNLLIPSDYGQLDTQLQLI